MPLAPLQTPSNSKNKVASKVATSVAYLTIRRAMGFDSGEPLYQKDRQHHAIVYPALGSDIHLELAASHGAVCTDEGCVFVDHHQRMSARGFYAAGDVVISLD